MSEEIQYREEKGKMTGRHLKGDMGEKHLKSRDKGIRPELLLSPPEEFVKQYKHNTCKAAFCKYKLEPKLSDSMQTE